jgi:putative membrane protein
MSDQHVRDVSDRFEVRATADSHFSWIRTRLAIENTLMAYMRTAASLIGFGFAIVQFFHRMEDLPGIGPARFVDAPRHLGLALILCGVMSMVISLWMFRWMIQYLWSESFSKIAGIAKEGRQTPLYLISIALTLVGLFAFFAVLLRLV